MASLKAVDISSSCSYHLRCWLSFLSFFLVLSFLICRIDFAAFISFATLSSLDAGPRSYRSFIVNPFFIHSLPSSASRDATHVFGSPALRIRCFANSTDPFVERNVCVDVKGRRRREFQRKYHYLRLQYECSNHARLCIGRKWFWI